MISSHQAWQQSHQMSTAHADYPGLKEGEVSTGTTIMAIPVADGVIVGADSRVSTGSYVANRVSDKISQLSKHIFCCRSGSAADTQALTDYVKYYLQNLRYVRWNPVEKNLVFLICTNGEFHSFSHLYLGFSILVSRLVVNRLSKQQLI